MTRCRECDSQVAENDLFCPFCGARLEAASAGAGDAPPAPVTDEVSSEATTEPDINDIPTPDLLSDYSRTQENVDPEPTSEFSLDSSDELAAAAGAGAESTAVETTPEPPSSPQKAEPAEEVSAERPSIFEERTLFNEPGISRPVQDLEDSDPHASRSMFDSVRIMEPKLQDDVDTRIQISSGPIPEAPMPAVLSETTGVEPKPYTEPNMGMGGDTDGKRSKLKPLSEGTILNGRYEIVRKIGGGGMGAVYLASDNNLGGVLRAVKEMVQSHIEEEQQEKAINDFKRESMILSTLDHPSIPTIYDYFYDADEGRFYLVMKYISGGDLASRLRSAPEGKIDEKSITQWAIQICDVLDYLHNQPSTIVYRDLKPSNIMIDGNTGRIMLIDFGIARSISQKEEKGVTAVGTMGYAPPELFSGNVEQRSDIYSLGSTMFHLLTGADPQSNPLLIFDFQKNPRPRQINSQLSDQIERILMRAVEYNADMRFSSAAEMRSVLEDHLANLRAGNVSFGVSAVPASVSLENQSVFCGFCGQRIVATDLFCAFCGAKQPIAQQGVHSEIYSRSAATAKLIIEGTSELTTPAFSLQKDENLVGRRDPMSNIFPEVDLSKYDPQTKISRRHARIWREGGNFLVEDLGSSNGTVLATGVTDSLRLIPHKPHVLTSGDKLKVGDTTLHFLIG
jgi:serine/threonine protein kinase